jgi:hypothetical protein
MAVDITGFNRMRREQEEKAQAERERKEAEAKCTAQSNTQTNISADASTLKDGAKPATQTKKKPSGRQQKK